MNWFKFSCLRNHRYQVKEMVIANQHQPRASFMCIYQGARVYECCLFDVCATKAEKLLKRKDPGGNSFCNERQQPIYRADIERV